MTATIVILALIFAAVVTRDFVDNNALRNCAIQLKRLADAVDSPGGSQAPRERTSEVATPLKRIADAVERIEENHRQ